MVTVSWGGGGGEFVGDVFVNDILLGAEMALMFWSVSLLLGNEVVLVFFVNDFLLGGMKWSWYVCQRLSLGGMKWSWYFCQRLSLGRNELVLVCLSMTFLWKE